MYGNWVTLNDGGPVYRDGGSGQRRGLRTNSRYVELCANFGLPDPVNRVYLRVDGQWAQSADYIMYVSGAGDFNPYPVRFDFGSTATRNIEFFLPQNGNVFGFNVVTGSTVAPLPALPTRGSIWGDSYGYFYSGLPNVKGTFVQQLADRLGCDDPVPECVGSQGYVAEVDGRTIGDRITDDAARITDHLDWTAGYFSVNDYVSAQATVIAATVAGLADLQTQMPADTWIFWFPGFATATASSAPRYAAYKAALDAAVDDRTLIIDTTDIIWIATTGNLPNGQAHDSADNVHPGPNEIAYMKSELAVRMITALKAAAGIA